MGLLAQLGEQGRQLVVPRSIGLTFRKSFITHITLDYIPEALGRGHAGRLTLTLKELRDAGLVVREVHDSFPPYATYHSTPHSRPIVVRAQRLATSLAA